jgi:hypothetical protein
MQYFFHVIGAITYEDQNGMHFPHDGEAIAYAAVIARELAEDGSPAGYYVQVVDQFGNQVGRMPVNSGLA